MGEIQSTINQALALGAIGSGKFAENQQKIWENKQLQKRDDLTNTEKVLDTSLNENDVLTQSEKNELIKEYNAMQTQRLDLSEEANNYLKKKGWKNPDKSEFYRNMYNNLIEDSTNTFNKKYVDKIMNKPTPGQYFEQQKQKKANEMNNMQQASQAMNKVNEKTEFNNYRKENSKQRTEAIKNKENKAEKGKYVVNAMTLSGTYNPQDPARNMTVTKAKQEMAKQMELDQKEYENKKKENK